MTVHYLAHGSTVAHEIEANVAESMHFSTRVRTECLRCGEVVRGEGTWRTCARLWDGVKLCGGEREAAG